jgi:predicted metal-dependent phosphoesterase TrpH
MVLDLHIHTRRYSGCSNIDPALLLKRAKKAGLDGIALTEHGIRWRDEDIEELRRKSRIDDLVVIPGQEVACYWRQFQFQGEFLVFGYPKSLGSSHAIEEVTKLVHEEGGIVIAAHPFRKSQPEGAYYGAGKDIFRYDMDGLEILHPSYDEESRKLAREAMDRLGIAGTGSSDAHDLKDVGIMRSYFEDAITDTEALCNAIRARRVKAVLATG